MKLWANPESKFRELRMQRTAFQVRRTIDFWPNYLQYNSARQRRQPSQAALPCYSLSISHITLLLYVPRLFNRYDLAQPVSGVEVTRVATAEDPLRLAVFISGSGSGMQALLLHQESKPCLHETTLVVSNIAGVAGLDKAEAHNINTVTIELDKSISDRSERRETHERAIMTTLEEHGIEAVILSGYMRILSPVFVRAWKGRLLNIHPSLLPKYPGAHAHRDALADGATVTGCTVHLVDEGVDSGPILAQRELEIHPDDDEDSLSERVKALEHKLYPDVIDAFSAGLL